MLQKSVLAVSIAAALSVPSIGSAQQAAPAPAEAKSPHAFTGNITLITDYRFRGITQTYGKPAIQGGFDYAHASGFYLGNWNSNVSETAGFPGGNIEMDFYGGWKKSWDDWGLDVGLLEYYYPGSKAQGAGAMGALANPHSTKTTTGTVDNTEFYIGGSWKWLSAKWFHSLSNYFSTPDTKGSDYLDFSATYDIGDGWGLNGHVGHLKVHNFSEANYTDYKLGVSKDMSGWLFGAALVSTNAKDNCSATAGIQPYCFTKPGAGTLSAGKGTVLLSVGKTF